MPAKIKDMERDAELIKLKKKHAVEAQDYELAAKLRDDQIKAESKVTEEIEKWEE